MWCILFGVGVLVWGQLITTIPTKRIPKKFTWGSGPPDDMIDATSSLVEDGSSGSLSQDVKRTGQILWIRGLTRLQTQVCLIQLHNSTVSQQLSLSSKRASLGSPTSPTSLALAAVGGASGSAAGPASGGLSASSSSDIASGGGGTAGSAPGGGSLGSGPHHHHSSIAVSPLATTSITSTASSHHHVTQPTSHPKQSQHQPPQQPQYPATIHEAPELPGTVPGSSLQGSPPLHKQIEQQLEASSTERQANFSSSSPYTPPATVQSPSGGADPLMGIKLSNNNHSSSRQQHNQEVNNSETSNSHLGQQDHEADELDMR